MNTFKEYLLFDPLSREAYNLKENHHNKLKFHAIDIVSIGIILQNPMHLFENIIDDNPQGKIQIIGLILVLVQILFFIANKLFTIKFPKWNPQIMNTIYLSGFFIIQSLFFFTTEIYGIFEAENNMSVFDALWLSMELMIWIFLIFLVASPILQICMFFCIITYVAINVTTKTNFLSHVIEIIIA